MEIEADGAPTGTELEQSLRGAGWNLRTVEQGLVEILFVIEPGAWSPLRGRGFPMTPPADPLPNGESIGALGSIRYLVARESLGIVDPDAAAKGSRPWWRQLADHAAHAKASRVRVADAVAAGGFRLGAAPRRRILVLVLSGRDRERGERDPDASTFSPAGALAYLSDARVPIVVWSTGRGSSPEWPGARPVITRDDLVSAVAELRKKIDRQWIAWLEKSEDETPAPALPAGVSLVGAGDGADAAVLGRAVAPISVVSAVASPALAAMPAPDVYALAADPRHPAAVLAGTVEGVFATTDGGASWRALSPARSPVFSVAFTGSDGREVLAGASGAILHIDAAGGAFGIPLPMVQALALGSADAQVLYASTRGRLFRSADGGRRWTGGATAMDAAYTVTVSTDQRDPRFAYAGTMGSGLFRTGDSGRTWEAAGTELQDTGVRCVAVSPTGSRSLYAGTDGGLFVAPRTGRGWTPIEALAHTIVYAVAVDPADSRHLFAGTEDGLRESLDEGRRWTRRGGPAGDHVVTSLVLSGGSVFAGTLGGGVQVLPLSPERPQP